MLSSPGLTILWASVFVILCHAGPINRQASGHNTLRLDIRNQSNTELNVCVNDDVLYQPGDLMPAPNPCSRCVCSPPGSQCTPVTCEKKPGCKALLRPNQCCPEYQCECERNGRRYQNGERLDNADNPCEACYCQGGEVVCTTVECYRRDDCEPQFVPGRCCPKYDHCPPLVMDDARFAEPSAADSARPQHTRATFQPSASAGNADDQDLGASNVQERVHLPQEVATATTTPAPTPASDASPQHQDQDAGDVTTAQPAAVPGDAAIKIDVPAVPWTETTDADVISTTPDASDAAVEGSGAADAPVEKSADQGLVGVIEHVVEAAQRDGEAGSGSATTPIEDAEEASATTTVPLDEAKEESTESQTEEVVPVTRLFMLSKEAELDPTTVSTEYTDLPDEMSTTPEATELAKEATVTQGVDISTEALIEVTSVANDSTPSLESSTDGSPEFKDFDEWTGVKSSEFLHDSASSGHVDSSSSSDSHSKHAGSSSSDESTSHFLATNINPETVKLPSDSNINSALDSASSPHLETSATDSTESTESSEESATAEISTEHENIAKHSGDKDAVSQKKEAEADSKVENPVEKRIDLYQSNGKTKDEEIVSEPKNGKEKGQLDIILDTIATDENGPPILLIGDDLVNHQMDIVVATVPTEAPETATINPENDVETRIGQKEQGTEQPETSTGETPNPAYDLADAASTESRTDEPEGTTAATPDADEVTRAEVGVAASAEAKDATASTEKTDAPTTQQDMMLSDDPLPGQASSSETASNGENLDAILGKTGEKIESDDAESQKGDEAQSATVLTTVAAEDTTVNSVELRIEDLRTESPEKESTTNTAKNEEVTTLEPRYETTTIIETIKDDGVKKESKPQEIQYNAEEKVLERRGDMVDETATQSITDNPTPKVTELTTTEFITTQKSNDENTVAANDGNVLQDTTEPPKETANIPAQLLDNTEQVNSESQIKDNQAPEEPPKDITTILPAEATEIPTTLYPATPKVSNTKDILGEELLLGDQPQSDEPVSIPQSTENTEQKEEERKEEAQAAEAAEKVMTEQKSESEEKRESVHKIESEQATELAQRIDLEIPSETVQSSESAPVTESDDKTDAEQTTESVQKLKSEPQATDNLESHAQQESEQKDLSEQKAETVTEPEQQQEKEELSPILVDIPKLPETEDVLVRTGDLQFSSDESSTPPPDTTISDDKVQEETTTSPPAKTVQPEVAASTEESTTEAAEEQQSKDVKINPEVLELKPMATAAPAPPASNATDASNEPDSTTLSPQWLKTDNDSKEAGTQPHKEQVGAGDVTEQSNTEEAPAVTDHQTPAAPGEAAGPQEQQRLERRADEEDKKDLFLLEDFFTKLYRHQIATDATKH